jgi:hypothetical protein
MPLFKRREQVPNLALLRQECREFIRQLPLTDPDEDWIPTAIYYGAEAPASSRSTSTQTTSARRSKNFSCRTT